MYALAAIDALNVQKGKIVGGIWRFAVNHLLEGFTTSSSKLFSDRGRESFNTPPEYRTDTMKVTKILTGIAAAITVSVTALQATPVDSGAVTCSKCKIVAVKLPTSGPKGQPIFYHDQNVMVCPDCQSAIVNFFKTGKLKHTCSHCGGEMTVCH